ncbi:hypothetical protein JCM19301_283 [Jejuia pallidilutea]|jgi:hypothetical protein|uniref:Uncharacterized protein n=2 Tax=Jejuia pallidilutea TaxID=504487 RepID=A0A090VZI7_9FLAO|nr:hypothetical protein CLV33_10337 [Jejuia pallidilutea]GAL68343.1 hypothetical protein JCM19301_283 [Jejuia pallidilutea]GAL70180.1 hypothetical protein JCM19302_2755 [Jejuia pallidilutea]GAL88857.1 hypothetical protein JCM19538_1846 [Jejuia pallidilutea]
MAEDILQLDELLEHAQFHKEEYGDNFFVFLSKHYGELKLDHSKNHQEEQSEHEQLPFQYQGNCALIIAFFQCNSSSHFNPIEVLNITETNFHYFNLYASLHEEELLQPPRHS